MPKKVFIDPSNYFPEITDEGIRELYKLVEIVYNCHFSYAWDYKDDLYSVGITKALDFISKNNYDPTRSSLKNVLYTGMRNEMKNYLHKVSRDTPVDDEIIIGSNKADDVRVDDVLFLGKIDLPRCTELEKKKVLSTLQSYGFNLGVEPKEYQEVSRWVSLAVYQIMRGK